VPEDREFETILFGRPGEVEDLRRTYFRRIMLWAYPLGFLAVVAALALDLARHGRVVSPVDAGLLPVLAAGFLVGFVLLLGDGRRTLWVGQGLYFLFALYLVAAFAYQHFFYYPRTGYFSEVVHWSPIAYLGAFLFFPLRRAWRVGLLLWGLEAAVSLGYLVIRRAPLANLFLQYHAAGLATLGLGFLIALSSRWYSTVRNEATLDFLTRLPNRRYTQFTLDRMVREAQASGGPFAVVLLDLDDFKRVNDTYGHRTGDEVLRSLAGALRRMLREEDWSGRWGGEEFLILLPGTGAQEARAIAERLCRGVREQRPVAQPVTASLGVAVFRPGDTAEALVARADRALYRAKARGKGRVEG